MPNIGTTNLPNVDTNVVITPTIANITTSATANTETSFTFPANTKRFTVKNRSGGLIRFSYILGASGTTFFSIEPGTTYDETEIGAASLTIYLQSPSVSQILEIISWS